MKFLKIDYIESTSDIIYDDEEIKFYDSRHDKGDLITDFIDNFIEEYDYYEGIKQIFSQEEIDNWFYDFHDYYELPENDEKELEEYKKDFFSFSENIASIFTVLPEEDFNKFLDHFGGWVFETVGYSPWAYVFYKKYLDSEYVYDLYEGHNFYDITLYDEEYEILDSIENVYIREQFTDDVVLNTYIDHFGTPSEEIGLIDTPALHYNDIREIGIYKFTPVSYKFEKKN